MSDELLRHYNSELHFLRRVGDEFAQAHGAVAGNLKIGSQGEYDPFVGRLVEAFAFLNARTRYKLDDDFPEICSSMLEILYPHYLRPVPSASVVQFGLDVSQADMTDGYPIPRHTFFDSDPIDGQECRFRTCYPVDCWPLRVSNVELLRPPIEAPDCRRFMDQSRGLLRIDLETFSPDVTFEQLSLESLRFFLHVQPPYSFDLYELLFNQVIGVALGNGPREKDPVCMTAAEAVRPVGFDADQGLVEYPAQSFLGYRLLSEYFAFPEKFLFFDLNLERWKRPTNKLSAYLFLDRSHRDLEPHVSAETFRIGCTPIVNLYRRRAEPISLTHFDTEYPIVLDARRPRANEVYSVDAVTGTSESGEEVEFLPFYSFQHAGSRDSNRTFWHASRRWSSANEASGEKATDMFLSFVDLDFAPAKAGRWTIDVVTTCVNRNLPAHLPFGGGQPRLQSQGAGSAASVECLTAMTPTLRPPLEHGTRWRLVSLLALNHISLHGKTDSADALREILSLHDVQGTDESRKRIAGLKEVASELAVGRIPGRQGGPCRGLEVMLTFDEQHFTGGGMFLLASVLDRFLGLYVNINSFVQTVAKTQQLGAEELHRWPRRAGEMVIL